MPTEDHPLEYGTFEGVTRRRGDEVSVADGLERGQVTFVLHGEKLSDGHALTRFRTGKGESWLLVRAKDDVAEDEA